MTASFEHLLASALPRLHRAARGLLPDEQEAREIAQEALARALAARERYDPGRPFYPWVRQILRNAAFDARQRSRVRAVPGLEEARLGADGVDAAQLLDGRREEARLRLALERLSDDHREVLVMRHFEDLTYAEMGTLLGVPEGTVMSRLFRARRVLAAVLREVA